MEIAGNVVNTVMTGKIQVCIDPRPQQWVIGQNDECQIDLRKKDGFYLWIFIVTFLSENKNFNLSIADR
jgi:hypothetical protein